MTQLQELLAHIDALLDVQRFQDYAPNGLQVEGREEVKRLMTGVTASQALLDEAVEWGADAILVHHGYFWKGEDPRITGMKARRLKTLLESGISLLAYHLPLDAHPEFGNNAQLASRLGLEVTGSFDTGTPVALGMVGRLPGAEPLQAFADRVAAALDRAPVTVSGGEHPVRTVAWCTGAAQGFIDRAADCGVDAYLSGEISEPTVHVARERGLHYLAAGHHATERYGAMALGTHLAECFGLDHRFVDVPSPA
ncbi:MAG: Nif3-like dinuclear metal center hexameric protein [Ectothiorhodospiraceae bacterium]|nr:Nif3-like dinuclear metal center hexameric protein [Ectothiorhodospiraceae bacterium]